MPPRWVGPKTMAEAEIEAQKCEDVDTNLTVRKGRLLLAVCDGKLHRERGFERFEDWLAKAAWWTPQYCTKVMVFVRVFDDERLANRAGITKGFELIRLCEYTGDDPREIVAQDMVVAGRPYSKHTRKSLADAINQLLEEAERSSLEDMEEEIEEDWSTPAFSRPVIEPLAPEVARAANRAVRGFVKHAREEGIDEIDAFVVKHKGEAWATFKMRASEVPRFFDG